MDQRPRRWARLAPTTDMSRMSHVKRCMPASVRIVPPPPPPPRPATATTASPNGCGCLATAKVRITTLRVEDLELGVGRGRRLEPQIDVHAWRRSNCPAAPPELAECR